MQFSQAGRFAVNRALDDRKVPLTCREHVNHGIKSHCLNVPMLEISWVTGIIIEM